MKEQNYSNHVRYYTPHHFIFYPIITALTIISIRAALMDHDRTLEWSVITAALLMIAWLSFMVRQHYSLNNQNRIVRLEMRLRYYQLTHERFEDIEGQFSFGQIAALRFAPDAELRELIRRTLKDQLSPKIIKKSIKNWYPDTMRV